MTDDEITEAATRVRTGLFRLLAARAGGRDATVSEVMTVAAELAGIPLEMVLVEAVRFIEAALLVDESPFCDVVEERVDMAGLLNELERVLERS